MAEDQKTTEVQNQSTTTTTKKRPNKVVKYILSHKMIFSLLFALIVVFIWGQCKINQLEQDKDRIADLHYAAIDSLQKSDYMLVSKVFSWAVRSDMLRNNFEQANLYIEHIVEEPYVTKAYAIDLEKNIIILSSKKEDIGLPVADITLLKPTETVVQKMDKTVRFVSPINGLNRQIGISVIETSLQ